MPSKEELVNLLINNDIKEFNQAVRGNSADMTECDFSNLSISGAIFDNIDLTSSSFADSQLTEIKFIGCDMTSVDFNRSNLTECIFNDSLLNGADFSYSTVSYCNFSDADMAGAIVREADLSDSDFSMSANLNACRFDDTTVWPDSEYLPEDFDSTYSEDLSSLKDDDDYVQNDY